MRNQWTDCVLGDLVKIYSGVSPSNVFIVAGGGLPFVKVEDLNSCQKYQTEARERVEGDVPIVPTGSVLFPKRGAAISANKVRIAAVSIIMDTNMMALKPKVDRLDSEFLFYFIAFKQLSRIADVSSVPQINNKHITPYPISLPPLREQRRIAEILCTWDDAIEQLEALRAAKERRYNALARMFFDPCHPTFHGRPNAWQEFELGDVFRERNQSGEEDDRLLSITMNGGVIDREDVGRKDTSTEDKSNYKLILPGDIGYNTMRMWQGVSGLSALRGIISPAYTVVSPLPNRVLGRYAAHLFKSRRMVFDFERYSQGLTSDTWNLKFPAFSKIRVFLPSLEDQEKQANLLDALIVESTVIKKQLEALTRQKRGLMQKLLTGEWRVPLSTDDVEKSVKRTAEELTP
ncbi:MAG: Type I restriction-modification system, specificity subunit S [Pseudolabrys sp.]|jgi:type I restriction enzyme S subunit|nr:Type I restriction-modification system, specificity subunit S [Pseudolabrys sp.]